MSRSRPAPRGRGRPREAADRTANPTTDAGRMHGEWRMNMAPTEPLRALFLNCTLKRSPAVSHTEGLARKVIEWFDAMDVDSEIVRVVDYKVPTGVSSDEGDGDEWPLILEKVKAADILVMCTPIWFGHRSSVC